MLMLDDFRPAFLLIEPRGDVAIVRFTVPWVTEDINLDELGRELFALVEQWGVRRVIVSLHNVRIISSAGLGKFITLHRKLHRVSGLVAFIDLVPAVADILEASRLNTYLTICDSLPAALVAVGAPLAEPGEAVG